MSEVDEFVKEWNELGDEYKSLEVNFKINTIKLKIIIW